MRVAICGIRTNNSLDHIVHHILTIYALGASPSETKAAYDRNKSYQRRAMPTDEGVIRSLNDKTKFREALGKEKDYPNFLEFFQREIEQKGVEKVLGEYLLAEDDNAENMLARTFGGKFISTRSGWQVFRYDIVC